jgi:phosphoglycerate dehydrogenase-like enzyme
VTHDAIAEQRAIYDEVLGASCEIVYVAGATDTDRGAALARADAVIATHPLAEFRDGDKALLADAQLIQQTTAGVDHVLFDRLPDGVPVAANPGTYSEPVAEHVLAMTFAAAKRLLIEDRAMRSGEFNQFTPNRMLAGRIAAILGFGGIGQEAARLLSACGMRIHAINRTGETDAPVDFIGTTRDLEAVLRRADVIVISMPLTRLTMGLIGAREIAWTKDDAILVNVARGEIVDQSALHAHLCNRPSFTACLDAWWVEPVRHGAFRLDHPFLDLANVIASPHNSASVPGTRGGTARQAAENVRRALTTGEPLYVAGPDEWLDGGSP